MEVQSKFSLIDEKGLVKYILDDLPDDKVAEFMDRPENGFLGINAWPTLSFCFHDGMLYQLYKFGGLFGYDPDMEQNEDPSKKWVKVRTI